MTIRAPAHKFVALRETWQKVKDLGGYVPSKTVAKCVGKAISLQPALGPVTQLLTRCMQMDLAIHVEEKGWKSKMKLSEEAITGMQELIDSLEHINARQSVMCQRH